METSMTPTNFNNFIMAFDKQCNELDLYNNNDLNNRIHLINRTTYSLANTITYRKNLTFETSPFIKLFIYLTKIYLYNSLNPDKIIETPINIDYNYNIPKKRNTIIINNVDITEESYKLNYQVITADNAVSNYLKNKNYLNSLKNNTTNNNNKDKLIYFNRYLALDITDNIIYANINTTAAKYKYYVDEALLMFLPYIENKETIFKHEEIINKYFEDRFKNNALLLINHQFIKSYTSIFQNNISIIAESIEVQLDKLKELFRIQQEFQMIDTTKANSEINKQLTKFTNIIVHYTNTIPIIKNVNYDPKQKNIIITTKFLPIYHFDEISTEKTISELFHNQEIEKIYKDYIHNNSDYKILLPPVKIIFSFKKETINDLTPIETAKLNISFSKTLLSSYFNYQHHAWYSGNNGIYSGCRGSYRPAFIKAENLFDLPLALETAITFITSINPRDIAGIDALRQSIVINKDGDIIKGLKQQKTNENIQKYESLDY